MRKARRCKILISILKCTVCGLSSFVPRKEGQGREKGHIKTMWCSHCKKDTDFVENGDYR